jgi:hypothetical protein
VSRGFLQGDRSSGFQRTGSKPNLLVQDNTEEGIVDLNLAVVFDEAQFPEFVHEKIDPGKPASRLKSSTYLRW